MGGSAARLPAAPRSGVAATRCCARGTRTSARAHAPQSSSSPTPPLTPAGLSEPTQRPCRATHLTAWGGVRQVLLVPAYALASNLSQGRFVAQGRREVMVSPDRRGPAIVRATRAEWLRASAGLLTPVGCVCSKRERGCGGIDRVCSLLDSALWMFVLEECRSAGQRQGQVESTEPGGRFCHKARWLVFYERRHDAA